MTDSAKPRRKRRPNILTSLKAAKAAGIPRVEIDGIVFHVDGAAPIANGAAVMNGAAGDTPEDIKHLL